MSANNHTRVIDRRGFIRLAGLGAGAATVAACSTGGGGGGSGGTTQLLFWLPGGSDPYFGAHKRIAKDFGKLHKNVSVTVQRHTGNQDFTEVLLARIAAGNPPDALVIWDTPVSLGVRGSLEPLDHLMATSKNAQAQNWPAAVLASCQWKGKTYGLPATAGTYAMWYNQDLFEKKGVPSDPARFPKTWDDMRQLSKEFTHWDGDKLQTAGFIPPLLGATADENAIFPMWSALNGGQVFDAENRRYTIDSEPNIAMMEYFLSWLNDEYKGDIKSVIKSASWGIYTETGGAAPGAQAAFQNNRLAMMVEGSWGMGDLYAIESHVRNWELASLPVGPGGTKTVAGYWPNWLAIPTGSHNVDEAFKYLDYMSVEGVQVWFATTPDLPDNKKVPPGIAPSELVKRRGRQFAVKATDFFRQQLAISIPMWNSPVQSFAMDQLQKAIDRIGHKAASPKSALGDAQKACQAQLDQVA